MRWKKYFPWALADLQKCIVTENHKNKVSGSNFERATSIRTASRKILSFMYKLTNYDVSVAPNSFTQPMSQLDTFPLEVLEPTYCSWKTYSHWYKRYYANEQKLKEVTLTCTVLVVAPMVGRQNRFRQRVGIPGYKNNKICLDERHLARIASILDRIHIRQWSILVWTSFLFFYLRSSLFHEF